MHAVTCDHPLTQLQNHLIVDMVSGSQDRPLTEGQSITYSCPPGFRLNGPNVSACIGNGEWEPDPGEVECIGAIYHYNIIS